MPKLRTRTPIVGPDRDTFFGILGHLNHRYTMLWRHKNAEDVAAQRDFGDSICAYESGLMVCRVWMEFLGLGITYSKGPPVLIERHDYFSFDGNKTDEVKVVDLGGNFVKLSSLTPAEKQLLATAYHMAHKATAHFTHGSDHMEDPKILHQCVPLVDRLLRENLYDVVGKKPHMH